MSVTAERLREIATEGDGCWVEMTEDEAEQIVEELLAYRKGYDPAERLPKPGVKVLVQSKAGGLDSASIRVWADTGEQMWQGRGWSAPIGYAWRWYPAPGGER
jgi:hypothetical protein